MTLQEDCLDITFLSIISILSLPFAFFLLIYTFLHKKYFASILAIIFFILSILLIIEMYRILKKKFSTIIHLKDVYIQFIKKVPSNIQSNHIINESFV